MNLQGERSVDFQLSEDQQFFVETTRKFLAAECNVNAVRDLESDPLGFDPTVWKRGAELGWTSLLVPEADGGGSFSSHGLLDLVLVAEEMGSLAAPGPLSPVNLVADAVGRLGTDDQRAEVLPGLLDGSKVAAWCGPNPVDARNEGDGFVLTGTASPVEAGAQSQHLLVTVAHPDGLAQVIVPTDAEGLTITPMGTLDLVRRFAEVRFNDVVVPAASVLRTEGHVAAEVDHTFQVACVLQCVETAGVIDKVFETTLEYLGDRYSFGRVLSSYQALKHRVADQKVVLEACHGVAEGAAHAVAEGDPESGDLVSAAKAYIGVHATELIQDCVQLHGGIGVTWEHDLHIYLRRATTNRAIYGTPEEHAERVAANRIGALA
jgi:alkylation response protein AidB-like acyl-CoA dehydrogenase